MAEINKIFNFLKDFNELSNPVITDIKNQKWNLNISDIPVMDDIRSVFHGHDVGETDYLEVKRPTLLPCPEPPKILRGWIGEDRKNHDWDKKKEDILGSIGINNDEDLFNEGELFTADQTRVEALEFWWKERELWKASYGLKVKGLELYNKLFKLYSEMKLESESVELILGDGIIRWNTLERKIDHPVLLQKVFLHFDPHIPSFRVYCEEKKTEIYMPMLRVIPKINQQILSEILIQIDDGDFDIADIKNTTALFKQIINVVDKKGTFVEQGVQIDKNPKIHSAPVLFQRKRTLGFSNFIESVIEEVQTNSEIELPGFFEIMSGKYTEKPQEEIIEKNWNYSGIDEEVLLTLEANNEQLRIIKYLDRYGAVLVQGPPGTGKTHTIANLIGHLLSQGNSVLVTSHTEKALTVLKEKIYKDKDDPEINLQNLCISILSSTSQKKEMDGAINEIAAKSSSMDLHSSFGKIELLKDERRALVQESKRLTEELVRVRVMEYNDLIYDNHSITPIDAAKFLNSGNELFDYFIGKSKNDEVDFPLTQEELEFLYSSNGLLSLEEEELLKQEYPATDQMISSVDFANIADRIIDLRGMLAYNDRFKDAKFTNDRSILIHLEEEVGKLISVIHSFKSLGKAIINQTISDPIYPKLWEGVLEKLDILETQHESYRKMKLSNDFLIEESLFDKVSLQTLQNIIDSGKEIPIGLFAKGEWKRIRDAITVNGRLAESREEFIKAYELISYDVESLDIIKLSGKLLSMLTIDDEIEIGGYGSEIFKSKDQIVSALKWFSAEGKPCLERIEKSIKWGKKNGLPLIMAMDSLDSISEYLYSTQELLQVKRNEENLSDLEKRLQEYELFLVPFSDQNPYIESLTLAIRLLEKTAYSDNLKALSELTQKSHLAKKRKQLFSRIREIAPEIAMQIESREGIHSENKIPKYFNEAWKHFQLRNQIERIASIDLAKIQNELAQVNNELLKNARILAFEKAWYQKIISQTDIQNQALQGWRNTVKQIGKGTGKNAPMLKAKARELMPLCQIAIPVWIMPLYKVMETFNPKNNKFDVIIIDEASQANILSLAALYLGKKVIIVGDDEQVSPDTVGVKTDEVSALVAQHLDKIPNNHLFNGLTSLYDMAKSSGFKPLMLTEHFRCLPEIIGFSNELSYNGRIKPLRDASKSSIHPQVVEYRVFGATRDEKKVNEVEADHIVSLIQAFLDIEEYKDQTIGVISMLGNEQSTIIEKKLQAMIDPIVYEKRRIQCGTPPQFQGDERDVILLSLVDSPNETAGPLRLLSEDGNNDKQRKRFNVATSRARNQLWVVHSLNPEIDLKPDDLRFKLIKYAITPNRDYGNLLSQSESPFEHDVMKYLLKKRYTIIPQYIVGAYRLDMVVKYGKEKVALECDGERFHNSANLSNDLARQAILERMGWRFIRIRGREYYRDPEQTMKNVLALLARAGIHPSEVDIESDKNTSDSLLNAVKIKASIYRNQLDVPVSKKENLKKVEVIKSVDDTDVAKKDLVKKDLVKIDTVEIDAKEAVKKEKTKTIEKNFAKNNNVIIEHCNQENSKDASTPTFDFRGKQKSVSPKTEALKALKVAAVAAVEVLDVNNLPKPKFDFRNGK